MTQYLVVSQVFGVIIMVISTLGIVFNKPTIGNALSCAVGFLMGMYFYGSFNVILGVMQQ